MRATACSTSGQFITGNDPNDANVPSDATFQQGWVQHLVSAGAPQRAAGCSYYILDNEPSIWHATHRDVHPDRRDDGRDAGQDLDYAGMIKSGRSVGAGRRARRSGAGAVTSTAATISSTAATMAGATCPTATTTAAGTTCRGCSINSASKTIATGQRLLDVFTVHYYPQGGEFSNDVSTAMQLRRNRSTRSLWDPNYVDETWINDTRAAHPPAEGLGEHLLSRARRSASPSTTGARRATSTAPPTQADILGIFGREGLDMAARWTTPDAAHADLQGDEDVSQLRRQQVHVRRHERLWRRRRTRTRSPRLPRSARSDGALTVMVINKQLSGSTPATINLANFRTADSARSGS